METNGNPDEYTPDTETVRDHYVIARASGNPGGLPMGRNGESIARAEFARWQAQQQEPNANTELEIVNGYLVSRGVHAPEYPGGPERGMLPYSDAEPLLNLSKISGWPQGELAAIDTICELHVPDSAGCCTGCGTNEHGNATVPHPCPTRQAIPHEEYRVGGAQYKIGF
ncbi:hypothetical protein V5R04_06765 [Jonesiaceae bacterium BS-20]|uniref:Uncharacterized protein n=1 Tax=Jonesiaceae bacterium BS-20 TaxID=3120821 RepID=A0AAU7E0K8_9MICO